MSFIDVDNGAMLSQTVEPNAGFLFRGRSIHRAAGTDG